MSSKVCWFTQDGQGQSFPQGRLRRTGHLSTSRWVALVAALGALGLEAAGAATQPVQAWEARYTNHGPRGGSATLLQIDAAGQAHVAGTTDGAGTGTDYLTLKYDPDGRPLWAARFDSFGPDTGDWTSDYVSDMVVDREGNVIVTGSGRPQSDFATVKYDPNGNRLWVARYAFEGSGHDPMNSEATALTVDSNGCVYVTGRSSGGLGAYLDLATVKYDPSGHQLWVARYGGYVNENDSALAIQVDYAGQVHVLGESWVDDHQSELVVLKYANDGRLLWVARHAPPGTHGNSPRAMALDAAGNVYVHGTTDGAIGFNPDYSTVKFDANGNLVWAVRYDGPAHSYDHGSGLALDGDGNVIVTGTSCGTRALLRGDSPIQDFLTIKYDADGHRLWVARQSAYGINGYVTLALDSAGHSYLTGPSRGEGPDQDFLTLKYDRRGNLAWQVRHPPPLTGVGPHCNASFRVALGQQTNVFVTGYADGDFATVKYLQTPVTGLPAILTPPQSQTVGAGATVTLSVQASGADPLHYQWVRNGFALAGATEPTLVLENVMPERSGEYSVEVSNALGQTASPVAALAVTNRPDHPSPQPAPDLQMRPAVATDGTNFLVVWMDRRNALGGWDQFDLYGARVTPDGQVLDLDGIALSTSPAPAMNPAVAFDGANYLVVWEEEDDDGIGRIKGTRVSPAGEVLDPAGGFTISEGPAARTNPVLAFSGGLYLVLWNDWRNFTNNAPDNPHVDIYGARVTPAGTVLDQNGLPIVARPGSQSVPQVVPMEGRFLLVWHDTDRLASALVSTNGTAAEPTFLPFLESVAGHTLAAWGTNCLLAWNEYVIAPDFSSSHYATRLSPAGAPLDGPGFLVDSHDGYAVVLAAAASVSSFWLAWETEVGGTDSEIQGRRLGHGGEFLDNLVLCTEAGAQSQPALACNAFGCLAVWRDGRSAPATDDYFGSHFDIYGTVLSPAGTVRQPGGFVVSTVTRGKPVITWPSPAGIVYGTPLGEEQLNATADVPGTFLYLSPPGTILNAGYDQILHLVFTPEDTNLYTAVPAVTTIDVYQASMAVYADHRVKYQGQPNPVLSATYYGLVAGDTPADLEVPARLETTAALDSPVGTYPIYVRGAEDPNYSITRSDGLLIVLARTNDPGVLDLTFDPTQDATLPGFDTATVHALAVQPDGKVVVGGQFRRFNGIACNGLVRLKADGTLDAAPSLRSQFDWFSVEAIALAPEGRIVIGFSGCLEDPLSGQRFCHAARLNADFSFDLTFRATNRASYDFINAVAVQPDGKVLLGGVFFEFGSWPYQCLVRLNTDGSVDRSFQPVPLSSDGEPRNAVNSLLVQPDGKIVALGGFDSGPGGAGGLIRVHPDGRVDTNFARALRVYTENQNTLARQPDGKLLLGASVWSEITGIGVSLARLNPDGTPDASFHAPAFDRPVRCLALLPDGSMLVATNEWAQVGLVRLRPDGTVDGSFQVVLEPSQQADVRAIAVAPNGQAVIGGRFEVVNGHPRSCVARLSPPLHFTPPAITVQPTNQALYAGQSASLTVVGSGALPLTYQWLAGYAPILGATNPVLSFVPAQVANTGWYRVALSNPGGAVTSSWAHLTVWPPVTNAGQVDRLFPAGWASVDDLAQQPDGQVLVAGGFSSLARLTTQAALDPSFVPRGFWSSYSMIPSVAIQSDGRILVSVSDYEIEGTNYHGVVRLLADGSLDATFRSALGPDFYVMRVAVQADGRILAAGEPTYAPYGEQNRLVRLLPDGQLDASLAVTADGAIRALTVLPTAQILIAGEFRLVNGQVRSGVARLQADGTLDGSFDAGLDPYGEVYCLAPLPDGRLIIGGSFEHVHGVARQSIARLNRDGGLDTTFAQGVSVGWGEILAVAIQADGRLLIGGTFQEVNGFPRGGLARLNSDGSLDLTFQDAQLSQDDDDPIEALQILGHDWVLAGGQFPGGLARVYLGEVGSPPVIVASPASLTVVAGGSATLSVQAAGTPPLWYQWRLNGTAIADANGETLYLTNVRAEDAGLYSVVVSNAAGVAISSKALLTVLVPPGLTLASYSPTAGATLMVQGQTGHTMVLQVSPDLTAWTQLGVATVGPSGHCLFVDPQAGNLPVRLYRAWDETGLLYSTSAVGLVNLTLPPGLSLVANQFLNPTNTFEAVLPTLPAGVSFFKAGSAGFVANNRLQGWSEPDMTLLPGEGAVAMNPYPTNLALSFKGELANPNHGLALPPGLSLFSPPWPRSGWLVGDLEFPAVEGDMLVQWRNGQSLPSVYFGDGAWDPAEPRVSVGEALWFLNPGLTPRCWSPVARCWPTPVLPRFESSGPSVNFFTFHPDTALGQVRAADGVTPLAGAAFRGQLYFGSNTVEADFVKVGSPVPFGSGLGAGYLNAGVIALPGAMAGQTSHLQLRVWESSGGESYEAATASHFLAGKSAVFAVALPDANSLQPPPSANGFPSFSLTDDPAAPSRGRLLVGERTSAGRFPLRLLGRLGARYEIQTSDDLKTWSHFLSVTNTAQGSDLPILLPAEAPHRFYRARLSE